MGLDTVELVMRVEERFEIEIANEEAETVHTVRDLTELVFRKVRDRKIPLCRTQQTFYRLRRAVCDELGIDRVRIRPDTLWGSIIPLSRRRELWQKAANAR